MARSTRKKPKIVSASGTVNADMYNVTIETNGSIEGVETSTKVISVWSGANYSVEGNTITFDGIGYEELLVLTKETEEDTENYAVSDEEVTGQYDNVVVIDGEAYKDKIATVIKPDKTEKYVYDDYAIWSSTSGTITSDITITANFNKSIRNYDVTIKTNGTINGTIVSKKICSIPYGAEFLISGNTIDFKNKTEYDSFLVFNAKEDEYLNVKDATTEEYNRFNSLSDEIEDVSVVKPEDTELIKYESITTWYLNKQVVTEGTITEEVVINAIFDTAPIYEVTISTNGQEGIVKVPIKNRLYETIVDVKASETEPGTIVDKETTKAGYSIEYTSYETSGCIITFSDGQKVELHKPEDTEYAKYDSNPTWTPSSGTITDNLVIDAFFTNTTAKYEITITTNGTISGEAEGTKTKKVQTQCGDTYQITGDTIAFSNGTSVTVVKPEDDYEKEVYGTEISWSEYPSGTISSNLNITANFISTPVYEVEVQKDADGEKTGVEKIHVLKGAKFSTSYSELDKTNDITFSGEIYLYNVEEKKYETLETYTVSVSKPKDDQRHKYYNKANWYNSSDSTNTINSNTTITALFSFIYKYKVTVLTNKVNDGIPTTIKTDERYVFPNTEYSAEDNVLTFTYEEKSIGTIVTSKPEADVQWEYSDKPEWDYTYGLVTEDTIINANFVGSLVNYEVSITIANGSFGEETEEDIIVDEETGSKTIKFKIPYSSKYSKDGNTIIFKNKKEVITLKEITIVKPEDDDSHKYNQYSTWNPESGEITEEESSRTISAKFDFISKYKVTVKTNGFIKDTTTNDRSLIIISGTTYETDGNIITFTYNDAEEEYEQVDVVEVVKPKDTIQIVYNEITTWNPSGGTIEESIDIEGNFESSPQYYDVDIKTNGTFDTGYHEMILSLPYGTEYETYAKTSGEVTKNGINFIYNNKIIETHELERPDSSYTYNVVWEPDNSGAIIGNTEETVLKNIEGNFKLKKSNEGEVVIFDKYTIDEGYVKMNDEGKIVVNEDTMPYGYKARIMKLYVVLFYVGDEEEQEEDKHFLVRWKLSVCDRLYTYIEKEGKKIYTSVDSMPEDGDWYTTGPTIVKIDGEQRYFHVETGTTQGELEGLNDYPSIPGYIEGEFYKDGDAKDVCDPIDYSLITFIGNYSREERNAITTQILLNDPDNPTYNYKYGSLERYFPKSEEEFPRTRKINVDTSDNFIIVPDEQKERTVNYGDSVTIEVSLKPTHQIVGDESSEEIYTNLFSRFIDNNGNVYTSNPLTIDRITDDMTFTAYSTEIYGVKKNINADNSSWERTNYTGLKEITSEGNIEYVIKANATHDGTSVRNDFDDRGNGEGVKTGIYPWNSIITVNIDKNTVTATYGDESGDFKFDGSNGDVMTYVPKHYARRYLDSGNECIQISKNTFIGATEIKPFYISRYPMSEDYMSKNNTFGQVNQTIDEFRDIISTNKGEEWSQLDWRLFVIKNLYLVEYASGESRDILGKGVSDYSLSNFILSFSTLGKDTIGVENGMFKHFEPWLSWDEDHETLLPYVYKQITYTAMSGVEVTHTIRIPPEANSYQVSNGECDDLGMRSGCLINDGHNSVIYRGIENPFGNIWCFVDGINIKDFKIFVCTDHEQYKSKCYRNYYDRLGYISSIGEGSPAENGFDSSYPLISIPTSTTSTQTNGYYWRERGERILISGGHWYVNSLGEIFNLAANYTPSVSRFDIGTRLLCDGDGVKNNEE